MAELPTVLWRGFSRKEYRYWIYPIGTAFEKGPGNYVFAKETRPTFWAPVYVGETEDLSTRFDNHEKLPCIMHNNATHLHIHAGSSSKYVRMEEKADITLKYDPPCNKGIK